MNLESSWRSNIALIHVNNTHFCAKQIKAHLLMTDMVSKPGRELAECNKSNRTPTLFFASDASEAGSRTG